MAVERGAGATAGAARQVRIHELGAAARAPERRRLHGQTPLTSVAPERAAPHRSRSGECEGSSSRGQPRGCSLGHMSIGSIDFPTLLRAHVYVQGGRANIVATALNELETVRLTELPRQDSNLRPAG